MSFANFMKLLIILAFLQFTLISCSQENIDPTANWSAQRFYTEANLALDSGQLEQAIDYLETLEARFPFGQHATQAQLDVIYAYYRYDEPDSAIAAANRFIKLYPRHPNVDYAYYMRGLANFDRGGTIMDLIKARDLSEYDTVPLKKSFQDLSTLIQVFPDSKYANDVKQRLVFMRNIIAKHELNIAEYYLSREAYVAAVNRAKIVLEQYQGSESVKPALELQLKAYQALGLTDLANDVKRILDLNFGV